jgi:plastocyanin
MTRGAFVTSASLIRRSTLGGLAALLSVTLLATACSSSKKSSATGNGGAATTTTTAATNSTTTGGGGAGTATGNLVHVKNFAFDPGTLTVPVGSAVTWEFDDSISHNVTGDNNAFSSSDLNNGQKFTFTFSKAGTYNYMCSIHPRMKATVIVK